MNDQDLARWYEATLKRFSMRKLGGNPTEEELQKLSLTASSLSRDGVRIVVGADSHVYSPMIPGFGKITGTDTFAAFLSKNGKSTAVGYLGEAFILECTAMGLGTCWLGASYHKSAVKKLIDIHDDETIACITCIGKPGEDYVERPRKPVEHIVGFSMEQLAALPEWQMLALRCVRMAPSAVNGQPWEFRVDGDTAVIQNIGENYGYGMLDCGIAMLHLELGAFHSGVRGSWELSGKEMRFHPESRS